MPPEHTFERTMMNNRLYDLKAFMGVGLVSTAAPSVNGIYGRRCPLASCSALGAPCVACCCCFFVAVGCFAGWNLRRERANDARIFKVS